MKKHFLKSFALIAMLFSALTLSAAEQYCHKEMTSGDKTIYVTGQSLGGDQYQLIIESDGEMAGLGGSFINVNGVGGYQLNKEGNFELSADKKTITCNITSTVPPTHYTPLYVLMPGEVNFGQPDIDYSQTCASSGDETPDTEAPVMTSATFVSASDKSVVIAVEATDNVKVASYLVKNGDVELGTFTAVNNNITVTGLEPSTTYQLTVFAKDATGNISTEGKTVEFTTDAPPTNPYCNKEIGHFGAENADSNSFILLSVGYDGYGHTIVNIKQDKNKNSAMFDYINIVGIKETGADIDNGGSDEMAIMFKTPTADENGNIKFTLQWSTVGWGGRWQINDIIVPAEVGCDGANPYPNAPYTYCVYTDNSLKSNDANVALTWATDENGNVVIDITDGPGASNSAFRNGGFENEDSFADSWKVYSGVNYQTIESATEYFNNGGTLSHENTRFTLTKKEDAVLPDGALIVFMGHAFSWSNDQSASAYTLDKMFVYSYGASCPPLEAPTNVAVTDAGVVTFDEVLGAISYEVRVYQSATLKHTQELTSGDTLNFIVYVAGEFTVKVVAKAAIGRSDSFESDGVTWNVAASPLPGSNYCETLVDRIKEDRGGYCSPLFTWITDDSGNVVITVSASEGEEGETMFRGNGMKNENTFRLDGSVENFNAYFNGAKTDDYTYTLTLKDAANKPVLGSVISFSGQIEAKSSVHTNDWSIYEFDAYLYGTTCEETTEPDGPTTNVENTLNSVQIQKTIRNGALYIIYNGVTYDVMGRVVR